VRHAVLHFTTRNAGHAAEVAIENRYEAESSASVAFAARSATSSRMKSLCCRLLFPTFLGAFNATAAAAQDRDAQLWTQTSASLDVGDFELGTHFIARAGDAADGIYQLQFGVDVQREIGGGIEAGIGYSYVPSYEDGRITTREHRIRQQVSVPLGTLAGGETAARLRLEQRWRDDGEDLKFRLRPRLTWTRPIGPGGLAMRLAHESFVNLNDTDWGDEARYDRMRNQIALRRNLAEGLTGEVGYLNQYIFQGERPDEVDHALTLAITFSR
jgi:hypothetical protein